MFALCEITSPQFKKQFDVHNLKLGNYNTTNKQHTYYHDYFIIEM
jgi:hypothetical protein